MADSNFVDSKILSIVVPVYMVERFIDRCLSSLIVPRDLMAKLDVIVISDATPDKSAELARVYQKQYPETFRVMDQEHRGHGGAWNHGTELARGKYLFYVDSDDWCNTEDLAKLIVYLESCDADMVFMNNLKYYAEKDKYEAVVRKGLEEGLLYDANTFDWVGHYAGENVTYAHNTVYRTGMMKEHLPLFCEQVMYDDVSLGIIPITVASSFVYVNLNVYRYYCGRSGQSYDPKVRVKRISHLTKVIKFCMAWGRDNRYLAPECSTRRIWADYCYNTYGYWHYRDIAKICPYSIAFREIGIWDKYLKEEYPEVPIDSLVKRYRKWPFFFFYYFFRAECFAKRVNRFVDRALS